MPSRAAIDVARQSGLHAPGQYPAARGRIDSEHRFWHPARTPGKPVAMNWPVPHPRIALVTGAAKRLGRSMALALAEAGWDVVVHYHRSESEARATVAQIQQMGRTALALQADLASPGETEAMIPACIAHFGRLHCLVNNASLFEF